VAKFEDSVFLFSIVRFLVGFKREGEALFSEIDVLMNRIAQAERVSHDKDL
jgi:hypothetical protein